MTMIDQTCSSFIDVLASKALFPEEEALPWEGPG